MNKAVILIAATGLLLGATGAQTAQMHKFVSTAVAGAARNFVGYKTNAGAALSGDCGLRAVEARRMLDCRFEVFQPGRAQFTSLFKAALPPSFKSLKCTFGGAYPHEDVMEEVCFRDPGGVEADVGTDDSGAVHLYFFALADWRPAAMRGFFTWALDTAYQMSAPGPYTGASHSPDAVLRVIGGCDPQTRDNPLRVDLLCGSAPAGVFTDQADFLAIANGSMPAGFAKTACPKVSSLPDYMAGEVLLECLRNSNGTEIDLERNTDPHIKGLFGISVVMLPHT